MKQRTAFCTGISGMDGSHLADLLLEKDYKVYGLVRRHSTNALWRIEHILDRIELVQGDLQSSESLGKNIALIKPDEIYNMGAQSYVKYSFEDPLMTADITGVGALRLIEEVRQHCPTARVYQASSSEQFGKVLETPQDEETPFYPRSPYGCAKVFAHYIMKNYRESYKMHISCGICFNHESERRGLEFVSRKITDGVAKIVLKQQKKIKLGNLKAERDWGYAPDYVRGMWMMLQRDEPNDYVLATGRKRSVKEFLIAALDAASLPGDWRDYYEPNMAMLRPAEVDYLLGESFKIWNDLGWNSSTTFETMVKRMYEADYNRVCQNIRNNGSKEQY